MSLPALINRLRTRTEVLGRFHDEWTVEEVRRADMVLFDIHWYFSIRSAIQLSFKIKSINPGAPIVAGGVSATVFARQILRDSAIDYIIRGDGEVPLTRLAEAVLHGEALEDVPNLISRDFESDKWYSLTQEDLDAGDFRDISWFPTLQERTYRLHRRSYGRVYSVHPILVVFRGCPMGCDFCLGSVKRQKAVFRRPWIARDPIHVREDLVSFSNDRNLQFVSIYHDFLTMCPPDYAETVLNRRYDLNIRIELFRLPTERAITLLTDAFSGGKICFSLDERHASSDVLPDIEALIARIRQVQAAGRFETWVSYVEALVRKNPSYAAALRKVVQATRCRPDRVDAWWDLSPVVDEHGFGLEEEYQESLRHQNRYYVFNRLFRLSVVTNTWAPRLTNTLLRLYSNNNLGSRVKPWNPR